MTEQIIEQSVEEVAAGTPIIKVLDVINQNIEKSDFADEVKSSLAHTAIAHGNISELTRHDLVASQSLEPQEKVPRMNPEADRLFVLALAKQRRNKRRRL